jgi:hypothetical protein
VRALSPPPEFLRQIDALLVLLGLGIPGVHDEGNTALEFFILEIRTAGGAASAIPEASPGASGHCRRTCDPCVDLCLLRQALT